MNLLIKGWLGHGIGGKESLPLEEPDSGVIGNFSIRLRAGCYYEKGYAYGIYLFADAGGVRAAGGLQGCE